MMTMMFLKTASRRLLVQQQQQQRSFTLYSQCATSVLPASLHRGTPSPLVKFSSPRNTMAVRLATSSSNGHFGGGGGGGGGEGGGEGGREGFFDHHNYSPNIWRAFGAAIGLCGCAAYTAYVMQRDKADWQKTAKLLSCLINSQATGTIEEELEDFRRWKMSMDVEDLSWYDIRRILYTYFKKLEIIKAATQVEKAQKELSAMLEGGPIPLPERDSQEGLLAMPELTVLELKQALERDEVGIIQIVMYHGDGTFEEVAKVCFWLFWGGKIGAIKSFHIKLDEDVNSAKKLSHELAATCQEFGYNIAMSNKETPNFRRKGILLYRRKFLD